MLEIKAVCFDMDGLLFNTEDLFDEVGHAMLQRRGMVLDPEVVKQMMGQQASVALKIFKDHYQLESTVAELKLETDALFDELLPQRLQPMTGAVDLLESITRQKIPTALTTSSGSASVERIMSLCDLRTHFHFQLTAEDIEQSKPHPEIYLTAASRFGVDPSEMLVFEDSENGCKSGVAAGANVVAVPSKHSDFHNYEGTLFIADDLNDARISALLVR